MTEADVRRLARSHGLVVDSVREFASIGLDNAIWSLGDEWLLRTPRRGQFAKFMDGEGEIWGFAQEGGVRVPELMAFDHDEGRPYMIIRRVPGVQLGSLSRNDDRMGPLLDDLAEQLALLHSLPVPEDRREAWTRPFDDYDPWPYFKMNWNAGLLPVEDLREMESWITRLGEAAVSPERKVLTHNDSHPWNLLVAGDPPRLSAILDWGDSCFSDPRNDLSTLPLPLMIPLVERYRAWAGDLGDNFEARVLWAWIDIAGWEIPNLASTDYRREWWRWPEGGWPEVKRQLGAAPPEWRI